MVEGVGHMVSQQVVDEVLAVLKEAPSRAVDLARDPASTIEQITGGMPEGSTPAEILASVEDRLGGLDLTAIRDAAGDLDPAGIREQVEQRVGGIDLSGLEERVAALDPASIVDSVVGHAVSDEGVLGQAVNLLGGLFGKK